MKAPPLVSIITPTLNRRGLLMQTLDSLCDQTYPHWEAIVVDDGSADGTEVTMERFCRWEPRIRYMHRHGDLAGANVCRNQGVEASRGEYIIFLDSDDLLAPHCLEDRVKVMQESPDLDFAVFMGEMFNHCPGDRGVYHNVFDDRDDLDRFLALDNPWSLTGPIWRRVSINAHLPLWEELPRWQDWHLHVRVLATNPRYAVVPRSDYALRSSHLGHVKIGRGRHGPNQAIAVAAAFCDAARRIHSHDNLGPARRLVIGRLYWGLVRDLELPDELQYALSVWASAREAGVTGEGVHRQGALLLRLSRCPLVSRRTWLACQYLWKRAHDLAPAKSATYCSVPLNYNGIEDGRVLKGAATEGAGRGVR